LDFEAIQGLDLGLDHIRNVYESGRLKSHR
jgi:hypothetical protein